MSAAKKSGSFFGANMVRHYCGTWPALSMEEIRRQRDEARDRWMSSELSRGMKVTLSLDRGLCG